MINHLISMEVSFFLAASVTIAPRRTPRRKQTPGAPGKLGRVEKTLKKKTCWFAIGELFLGPPLEQETGGLVTLSHSLLVVNQSFPSLPSMSFSRMAGNKGSVKPQMIQTCA